MSKMFIAILLGFALISWLVGLLSGSGGLLAARLSVPVSANATTINVVSTEGFASSGFAMIQDETFSYSGKGTTTFTGVTRGIENTIAVSHPIIHRGLYVKVYSEEAYGINKAMGFDIGATMTNLGIVGIPVVIFNFFTITLPMVISWRNLDWMTGQLAIIRAALMIICAGFTIALFIVGMNNILSARK